MLYEHISDEEDQEAAARRVASRNMELVAVSGLVGLVFGFARVRKVLVDVPPMTYAIFLGLGVIVVGGALLMRWRPPAGTVRSIAQKLPKSGRQMLSRAALALFVIVSSLFFWFILLR